MATVAHFGFPKDVGAELDRQGRVGPHPVAPDKVTWAAPLSRAKMTSAT